MTEVIVRPSSQLIGQTLRSAQLRRDFQVDVLEIIRHEERLPQPVVERKVCADDILIMRGKTEDVLKIRTEQDLDLLPDVEFNPRNLETELSSVNEVVAEVLILSNSRLIMAIITPLLIMSFYGL